MVARQNTVIRSAKSFLIAVALALNGVLFIQLGYWMGTAYSDPWYGVLIGLGPVMFFCLWIQWQLMRDFHAIRQVKRVSAENESSDQPLHSN